MMETEYTLSLLQLTVSTKVYMKTVQCVCDVSGTNGQFNINISQVYV